MTNYLNSTPYHYEIGIFDGSFNSHGYYIEDTQLSLSKIKLTDSMEREILISIITIIFVALSVLLYINTLSYYQIITRSLA